ncbi:MAG: FHA domain-containing protein, partial [Deltaproteobacteria bacterium]
MIQSIKRVEEKMSVLHKDKKSTSVKNLDGSLPLGLVSGNAIKLLCVEGKPKDLVWELTRDRSVIGRNPGCDIVIDDPKLSRIHAEIIRDGKSLVFIDRESANGSFINSERVIRQVMLVPGDMIKFGDTTLKIIGEDLLAVFHWEENDPFVTSRMPLNQLKTQLDAFVSRPKTQKKKGPALLEKGHLNTAKLIKNLETIYQAGNDINSILNLGEMMEQIANTLLRVFADVERVCILLNENKGRYHFQPK